MDDGLKQRLIGAIVLIAIAVLFVPVLFERNSERELDLSSQIPAEPVLVPEPLQLEPPARPGDVPEPKDLNAPPEAQPEGIEEGLTQAGPAASAALEDPAPELAATPSTAPTPPPAPSAGSPSEGGGLVPQAWAIQVASFSEEARAQALVERLQKEDYKAYVRGVDAAGKRYHRVYVGPKLNRASAEQEKSRLDKALGANTLIVEFET